ncbi:MAG: hypothetical protein ACI8UD_003077, partial [Planctomycetota bacterium]
MQHVFYRPSVSSSLLLLVGCFVVASCGTAPSASVQMRGQDSEAQQKSGQNPSGQNPSGQNPSGDERQSDDAKEKPSHASLDLGVANTGISFGN